MDAHRSDFSFLPFHRWCVHGAVVRSTAVSWRFAAGVNKTCGAPECGNPADRLVHPPSTLFQLFADALSRSAAADRRGVSVRIGDRSQDGPAWTDRLDRSIAHRLLCRATPCPRTRMRSFCMDDAALQPCRMD